MEWDSIAIDFVIHLPQTVRSHDAIWGVMMSSEESWCHLGYSGPSGGGHVPPGAASSQTAWRVSVPPSAQRLKNSPRCRYRLAVLPSPPGARVTVTPCWVDIAWHHRPDRQALRYQALSEFFSIAWRNRSLPLGAVSVQQSLLVHVLYLRFLSILLDFWY